MFFFFSFFWVGYMKVELWRDCNKYTQFIYERIHLHMHMVKATHGISSSSTQTLICVQIAVY